MYSKRYKNDTGNIRYHKQKTCKECKNLFNPSRPLQTYCSYKCSNTVTNRNNSKKKEVKFKCKGCKKIFVKRSCDVKEYPSINHKRRSYCDRDCWKKHSQTIKTLKVKAWNEFSLYIRNRDDWTCFTCEKYERGTLMHAGHFISRRYNNTLFNEMNVHAQCAGCNTFRHGETHLYAEKLIKLHGLDEFNNLVKESKEIKKFIKQDLIAIYEKYKEINIRNNYKNSPTYKNGFGKQ